MSNLKDIGRIELQFGTIVVTPFQGGHFDLINYFLTDIVNEKFFFVSPRIHTPSAQYTLIIDLFLGATQIGESGYP